MTDSRYAGEAGLQAVFGQIKAAMAEKQDKINDMGLSHNDYSDTEKQKNAQNASDIVLLNNDIDDIIEKMDGDATLYQFAPVVTVEDAVPGNVALRAKVEPQQDLHGYDKPWVGGAGKNKLPMTVDSIKAANTTGTWSGNDYTIQGVIFTIQTDNDGNVTGIKLNGIASATVQFQITGDVLDSSFTGMILSGCPAGGSLTTYRLLCLESGTSNAIDTGSGATIGSISNIALVQIRISNGTNMSGKIFYPMLRLATETDVTFAPYSNICSITQYDSCKITRDGKNWFDINKSFTNSIVDHITNDGYIVTKVNAPVGWSQVGTFIAKKNVKYTLSVTNGFSGYCARIALGTSSSVSPSASNLASLPKTNLTVNEVTQIVDPTHSSKTFTSNEDQTIYLWICTDRNNTGSFASVTFAVQIEVCETVTPYEPYKGNDYQIELNGNTYYGQLRIDTQGNVYFDVDRGYAEFDGSDDESWQVAYNNANIGISGMKSGDAMDGISNIFPTGTFIGAIRFGYNNNNIVYIQRVDTLGISDVEGWKTFLSSNNMQIVYPLATPFTIALKDTPINLVKGHNTIYADTGDVEVTVNNTMDAIGSVQEQVNDHEERIGVVESSLTNLVKVTTAEITTNAYGWLYFPQNRVVLGAYVGDYKNISLFYDSGNNRYYSRLYLDATVIPISYASFDNNTAYTVTYVYIDNE